VADGGCKDTKSAAIPTGYGLFIHPWFATATRGHRSSSPLVSLVRLHGLVFFLSFILLGVGVLCCTGVGSYIRPGTRTIADKTRETDVPCGPCKAWTAENEPGYVQAMCWQAYTSYCRLVRTERCLYPEFVELDRDT
jgi:hypothetical protein